VAKLLATVRNDALKSICTVAGGTESDETLCRMGPNILPELVEVYRSEKEDDVLRWYRGLFTFTTRFFIYQYSDVQPNPQFGVFEEKSPRDLPMLSAPEEMLRRPGAAAKMRDIYLHWWDQRAGFLKRTGVKERIRALTGTESEGFARYDWPAAQAFDKEITIYGMYNLPYLIEIIAEDNNPIVFLQFLLVSLCPQLYRMEGTKGWVTGDWVNNWHLVQDAFSSRESKIAVIIKWWDDKKSTFTRLTDLYQAIDAQVAKLKNQAKAAPNPPAPTQGK